ncbi:MAG: helix-turn-helix domain-containing protein, partial [Pseudonocardiaceae bacterium]
MGSRPARHRYCRCGTHLAADNKELQCAQCARASRDKLIAPPQVPPEFWQTEQFREAFAAQHIGQVARAYRLHPYHYTAYGPSGISQTLLGQWLGLQQPQISRIETGPPIRDLDTLAYWARVLRIPAELLWFDMPAGPRRTTTDASTMSIADRQDGRGQEDATKRREAIAFTGKALTAALQPVFFEAVERSGIGSCRGQVDKKLVSAHQEISQVLAGLYRSADPRSVLPMITAYADELIDLLDASMSDSDRAALNTIVVGVHAQAGLWACHMHRSSVAYRYLATSREVAAATGDPSLQARSLGALSYLFSSAPRGGRGGNPQRCLDLLDEALSLARQADPFTRGWLFTWRADQHATLGNLAAARADLEAAGRGLGAADHSQLEGFFSRSTYGYGMEGHLIRLRMMTFALSGEQLNLEHAFSEVLSTTTNLRHQVCALANLAVVSAATDEPERACGVLSRSIQLAARDHYTMGLQRAIGVRHHFDPSWATLPAVRNLDDQLR